MKLIVQTPFDGRAVGSEITDPAEVEAVSNSERAQFVTRAEYTPPAQPKPSTEKDSKPV